MHLHTPLPELLQEDHTATRRDARTYSRAMLLRQAPQSIEASSFVSAIVEDVILPHRLSQGQLRPTMVPKYHEAAGAFLADLLSAAADERWSKLSVDNGHLVTVPGGKSAFGTMRDALGAAGLLEELPGYYKTYEVLGIKQAKYSRTCFRPTAAFLALAEQHGVLLANVRDHFAKGKLFAPSASEVLTLVAAKVEGQGRSKRLKVPEGDQRADRIVQDMERMNSHLLADGRISGIAFSGLRRSFNNADDPAFDYQWHGRYYSMPDADHYERLEGGKDTRERLILIDGRPAKEVDITASQLTILHGLLGVPFETCSDPYALSGQDRDQVKQWLMIVLGSFGGKHGGNRLKKAKEAGLARYPFLSDLGELGIGPLDLQFHEAEILTLAMADLIERGIGFLPVHDALMVAEGNEPIAEEAIRLGFDRYFRGRLGKQAPVPIIKWDRENRALEAPKAAADSLRRVPEHSFAA